MAEQSTQLGRRVTSWGRRPNLYYGWIVVGALAITEPISWGILYYGFGVMLTPMQKEMGWSQTTLTGAFSLMLLISGLMAIPVGQWLDRHGARGLMTLGSCLATIAVIGWAQVHTLVGFYLIWMAIGVISAMILYEPAFAVTAAWFVRRRSQALTLLTLGGGLASVIFVPLATWLVQVYGWRAALWILAAILAITTVPLHALLLRRRPEDVHLLPDGDERATAHFSASSTDAVGGETVRAQQLATVRAGSITTGIAVRGLAFWFLALAFAASSLTSAVLSVHLLTFLATEGHPAAFAALTASILGGSQLPGRLLFGPLGSRLPLRLATALLLIMKTAGLVVLMSASAPWLILAGVVLIGMGSGATSPARAALVGDFYGIANFGAISGVMALVLTIASAGAPVAMGALYTWTGGYNAVFWTLILSSVLAIAALLGAQKPSPSER